MAVNKFNSPYYGKNCQILKSVNYGYIGGISAYSTVLILVAYMNYFGLRNSQVLTPSRLLIGFLDFYGNYFAPNSLGISVVNEGYYIL